MATTLSTLVLRGSMYHFAHVGDTRIYLLRDGNLQSLTTDHVWQRPEMEHVLTRAVGLDTSVTADHGFGPLRPGDVFALVSDGVWAALAATDLQRELSQAAASKDSVEHVARNIVEYAHQLGSKDNATALVVRVEDVDANALRDVLQSSRELPALPPLAVGQQIDGFTVLERLHVSRVTMVYRVRDSHIRGARELVMKALTREAQGNAHERLAFAHERWLNKRVVARFLRKMWIRQKTLPPLTASAPFTPARRWRSSLPQAAISAFLKRSNARWNSRAPSVPCIGAASFIATSSPTTCTSGTTGSCASLTWVLPHRVLRWRSFHMQPELAQRHTLHPSCFRTLNRRRKVISTRSPLRSITCLRANSRTEKSSRFRCQNSAKPRL